jgi:hypothetical protein
MSASVHHRSGSMSQWGRLLPFSPQPKTSHGIAPVAPHPASEPLRQRRLGEIWEMIKKSVPIPANQYRSVPMADLRRLVTVDVP